jgi:hypothetical protein
LGSSGTCHSNLASLAEKTPPIATDKNYQSIITIQLWLFSLPLFENGLMKNPPQASGSGGHEEIHISGYLSDGI